MRSELPDPPVTPDREQPATVFTDDQLVELRRVAWDAHRLTPEPWSWHAYGSSGAEEPSCLMVRSGAFDWQVVTEGELIVAIPSCTSDGAVHAHHVATFDPPTVLALLAELQV